MSQKLPTAKALISRYRRVLRIVEDPTVTSEIRSSRSERVLAGPFSSAVELEGALTSMLLLGQPTGLLYGRVVVSSRTQSSSIRHRQYPAKIVIDAFCVARVNGRASLGLSEK